MVEGDMLDDGKTDPAPPAVAGAAGDPVETSENQLPMLLGNPAPPVPDPEIDLPVPLPDGGEFDPFRAAVQNCVGDQVVQRLLQQLGVSGELLGGTRADFQFDPGGLRRWPAHLHRAAHNRRRSDRQQPLGARAGTLQRIQRQKVQKQCMKPVTQMMFIP